jgi:transposase-like protein
MSLEQAKAEAKQIKDLEAENRRLKTEVAILKKAAAYFAKDQL